MNDITDEDIDKMNEVFDEASEREWRRFRDNVRLVKYDESEEALKAALLEEIKEMKKETELKPDFHIKVEG